MPQSIDPVTEVPHPTPSFVITSIPPSLLRPVLSLYRQGSSDAAASPPCHCQLELSIGLVEEQDPSVDLQIRWFVDYDPLVARSLGPLDSEDLNGDFNNVGTVRPIQKIFVFDADKFGIVSNGLHTVDAVVAEKSAYASPTSGKELISSSYNRGEYRFVVDVRVDQDPTRPTCPSNPPSIRVCQ